MKPRRYHGTRQHHHQPLQVGQDLQAAVSAGPDAAVVAKTVHQHFAFIPVPRWNLYHAWPSVAGLRYLIFNCKHNGFEPCVKRVGRRVLIDEQAFEQWVEQKTRENLL